MNAHPDHIRALTVSFLNANGKRIMEEVTEGLCQAGPDPLLLRTLLALTVSQVCEPSDHRRIAAIRETLAKTDAPNNPQPILSGQMALWSVLHRMLRDTEGPHRDHSDIYVVLALVGDILDGILGALIDLVRSGDTPPPGWETLVELGRTHRELRSLHQITHDLLNAQDPPGMFEILEAGILDAFHIRSLLIAVVNGTEESLEVVRAHPTAASSRDPIGWRFNLSDPEILCDVVRTGRTEVIDGWDPRYHERIVQPDGSIAFRQRPGDFNRNDTAFFIPIKAKERVLGVIATGSTQASKGVVLREIERMRPFLDQAGVALSVVSETIERRKAEAAAREADRVQVLMETAGAAAHEINQPLTVVLGLTQLMLLSQALDPALRHDIEAIHKAGQQIREIVRKMIDLRQYVTKPYIKDIRIVDFDAGSRKDS